MSIIESIEIYLEEAVAQHPPFMTAHHGHSVILEELDELWDEVKADNIQGAIHEAYHVAATAIRFIQDLGCDNDC